MRLGVLMSLILSGCATVDVGAGEVSHDYVGFVRVRTADTAGALHAIDVKTLGAGWDRGPFVGWQSRQWIEADTSQCQLVVIIRSGVEAAHARDVLRSLGGLEPCVADFTKPSPPAPR